MTNLTNFHKKTRWKPVWINAFAGYDKISKVLFLFFWCFKIHFCVLTTFWRHFWTGKTHEDILCLRATYNLSNHHCSSLVSAGSLAIFEI